MTEFTVQNADDAKVLLAMSRLGISPEPLVERALQLVNHLDSRESREILNCWVQEDSKVQESVLPALKNALPNKNVFQFLKLALLFPTFNVDQELIDLVWSHLASPDTAPDAADVIVLFKQPATTASELIKSLADNLDVALPVLTAWQATPDCGDLDTVYAYFSRALREKRSTEVKLCLKIIEALETDQRWIRYTALVGIAVVDASSNQLLDAFDVFRTMLDSTTSVPPPKWKVALVEALFDSMLTPMRLTAAKLMLSLDTKSLKVFRDAPDVAAGQVISQLCLPQYFRVDSVTRKCPYADTLEKWVHNLVDALGDVTSDFVVAYLKATVFENCRVYAPPVALVINAITTSSAVLNSEAMLEVARAISLMNDTNRALASKPLFASLIKLVVAQVQISGNQEVFKALPLDLPREHYIELAQVRPEPPVLPKSVVLVFYENTGPLMKYAHEELIASGQLEYPTLAACFGNKTQPKRGGCHSGGRKPAPFDVDALNLSDLGRLQLHALDLRTDENALSIECTSSEMEELMIICRLKAQDLSVLDQFCSPKAVTRPALMAEAVRLFFVLSQSRNIAMDGAPVKTGSLSPDFSLSIPKGYRLKLYNALRESLLRPTHRDAMQAFVQGLVVGHKSTQDEDVEKTYIAIIKDCATRRGILVPLVKTIIEKIGSSAQSLRILIQAYRLLYLDTQAVRLESFVAAKNRSSVKGADNPAESEDRVARALIMDHLRTAQFPDTNEVSWALLGAPHMFPTKTKDRVDGNQQRTRILTYQLVVALQLQANSGFNDDAISNLFKALDAEGSTRARIYIVWLIARAAFGDANVFELVLSKMADLEAPPRVVSSLIRVCLLVTQVKPDVTPQVVEAILPFAASSKVVERHAAVAALYQLAQVDFNERLDGNLKTIAKAVAARSAPGGKGQHRRGPVATWNINDLRPASICGGISSQVLDPSDSAPDCFLTYEDFSLAHANMENLGVLYERPESEPLDDIPDKLESNTEEFGIQKKSDGVVERTPLIVVATLCDRLPNLGGICRLCDALGVGKLVLNDFAVTKTTDFKSTAMTAERWQPMETVPEADLLNYLLERKKEGYTLVGLEQTDTSRKLDTTLRFPERTVLLIGRERLGIPSELLVHLDWCVEIEQRGVVRSMNVQTATAVLVHSYNNQSN